MANYIYRKIEKLTRVFYNLIGLDGWEEPVQVVVLNPVIKKKSELSKSPIN